MTWSNDYIGIPFKDKGRDRKGIDCWGLISMILQERFNVVLPDLEYETTSDAEECSKTLAAGNWRRNWQVARVPSEGCVVVLMVRGFPGHVGLMVDGLNFIHAMPGAGASVASIDDPYWRDKVAGCYRYAG